MRFCLIALLGVLISTIWGCTKDTGPGTLMVSGDVFKNGERIQDIPNEAQTLTIDITGNVDWTLSGDTPWCVPDRKSGNGDATITLNISQNISRTTRTVTMYVTSRSITRSFRFNQIGSTQDYFYQIPVVFHVLYADASDPKQNVSRDTLMDLLEKCNSYYRDNVNSTAMNLEFIPATTDPDGNQLAEPGIHRVQLTGSAEMDCNVFMGNKQNAYLAWNQNNYVNIMVYPFSNDRVLGISHIPYTIGSNGLAGLKDGTAYLSKLPDYPHCLSMNTKYLTTLNWQKIRDGVVTMAHELGHYLGLLHAFDETNGCSDTDYCEDTPTYNRKKYDNWLENTPGITLQDALMRSTCTDQRFEARNIMDYDYCYSDRFTLNQYSRIRNVLENSPLIPGPKNERATFRSLDNYPLPEVRTIE